jgi:hypothetical protein
MCIDPATMAIISGGMQVMSAVKGYQAQKYQGQAAANMANYNAQLARNNATIAANNAKLAGAEGAAATEAALLETRAKVGAISAAQAASGVDMNKGSAVDVRSSAAETGQLNAINVRASAVRKVYGYQQSEADALSQAGLYDVQAKNEKTAGDMNATTTLLGGLTQAGQGYMQYKQVGGL